MIQVGDIKFDRQQGFAQTRGLIGEARHLLACLVDFVVNPKRMLDVLLAPEPEPEPYQGAGRTARR